MFTNIFNSLRTRILAKCLWVNDVKIYNGQDIDPSEYIFNCPSVFINFENVLRSDFKYKEQKIDFTISVKIIYEDYTENYLNCLEASQDLLQYLNYYETGYCTKLVASEEIGDVNASNLYIYTINFQTSTIQNFNFVEDYTYVGQLTAEDLENGLEQIDYDLDATINDKINIHLGTSGTGATI